MLNTLFDHHIVIVVSDASIRNNIITSIAHIHLFSSPTKKTLYYAVDIAMTETELFAIRCGINQVVWIPDSSCIIVITDTLHMVQKDFDSTIHSYQLQLIVISKDLGLFLKKYLSNTIEFWNCSSDKEWPLHLSMNNDMKKFNLILLFPCKNSWDFNKNERKW